MTPLPGLGPALLKEPWVALDLETTGLDPDSDEIIEVGLARFQGATVLDRLSTTVNPLQALTPFVQRYTGITQADVDASPPFGDVAPRLLDFVGEAPIVGHNLPFVLSFLARRGVRFRSPVVDIRDLGSLLVLRSPTSLADLAAQLGVAHEQRHRAMTDAVTVHGVFVALLDRARSLDSGILAEMARVAEVARSALRPLLRELADESAHMVSTVGPGGPDLEKRLSSPRVRSGRRLSGVALPRKALAGLLRPDGPLAAVLQAYEARPQQEEMLESVARALWTEEHLMAEAGTGVGKSLAYLLPAALYAVQSNVRVVVSTNTLNLQEQLLHKDLPTVQRVLEQAGLLGEGTLAYTALKGRANYLCLQRWARLRSGESLTGDEAHLLGKLLLWLQETETGDRSELNLTRQESAVWDRLSAQGSRQCPILRGACFLRAARERADGAHVVVVNHALLLTDLQLGGGLIPSYDHLIVDEAHHLEEEATRQFGFAISYQGLRETLDALVGPRGAATEAVDAYRTSRAASTRRQDTERAAQALTEGVAAARRPVDELFAALSRFMRNHVERADGGTLQLLMTAGIRAQPDWPDLEILAENTGIALGEAARRVDLLYRSVDGLKEAGLLNYDELRADLLARAESLEELQERLTQLFLRPDPGTVYWMEESAGGLSLHGAPLQVGPILKERLFDAKRSVVLTSATLSSQGGYAQVKERLGVEEAEEVLLGSPFDYQRAALVCVPQDMPEPTAAYYGEGVARAVADLARIARGRTMALFTSHAALRAAASRVRRDLEAEGIRVHAQGVNGTPRRLLEEFLEDPQALLLGTASFWEGVDLAGEALRVLVLARLPFNVPTEPLFAARSQLYDSPFPQYALPQAILRFRQGFGRLIRTSTDRGVVVVLDRRITSRSYGDQFLRSLPGCTVSRPTLGELPGVVARWLES